MRLDDDSVNSCKWMSSFRRVWLMKIFYLQVAKCKVWQERECTLLVNSIASILMQRVAVHTASNSHKLLLEKCLRRLRVSEDVIADLITLAE